MPESDPALLPLCTHLKIFLIHFQSYNSFRWPVMKACVTNLFKGRSSRHEGERGMGRSKWFATSQRLRVIAAMVKGKAWRKVISTENLFGKMVAGLGLPFQILILASLVTIVLPTTPRHKIGGLCGLTGTWDNFHQEILCEFEHQLEIKGSESLQRPWSTARPNQRE